MHCVFDERHHPAVLPRDTDPTGLTEDMQSLRRLSQRREQSDGVGPGGLVALGGS